MTDLPDPVPASDTADPHAALRERSRACYAEVAAVLAKHRCRIVAFLTAPEPVGTDGAKAIIGASYGIVPA